MSKKQGIYLNIVIFIIMASIAIIDNTKGIFIPAFKDTFNATNTSMGFMLTACSLGYILFTYIGGILCEKFGQKKVIYIGMVSIIISVIIVAMSKFYGILIIGMFLINMGIAFVMIGINTLIPVIFVTCQAIMMNIAHCCYGFGSSIGQFSIGKILENGVSWRSIFIGISVIFIIVLILTSMIKFPVAYNEPDGKISLGLVFKEKYMYLYAISLGTYIFAEMGMSNWIVNFLIESYGLSAGKGATILSGFFFLLTAGRLIGGFVAEKFGYLQSVLISLIIATILIFGGLVLGSSALPLICIAGLFFAIAYPTIVTTISKVFTQNTSYITGVILTLASTISMILNLLIGRLNDVIGTSSAFYMIPISLIISIIFVFLIYIGKRNIFQNIGGKNIEK